ncbi:MAG: cytochrome C [Burkholderiales bacterium PBB2]|nr:MAG: cytochrome C [Burkholderiales bacterium PBB2]
MPRHLKLTSPLLLLPLLLAAALLGPSRASAATPAELLDGYVAAARAPADARRGQAFFTQRHGAEWSCASCHHAQPTGAGQHASTGKEIGALAPAFNPRRFSEPAKVEKWFRRNCKDVLNRECSAGEKADVLAWLMTLKP